MNVPNILTIFRLFLLPIYLLLFFSSVTGKVYWAFTVIIVAGITDVVDGYLARKNNQITKFGALLDPFADKVFMIGVFLSLLIVNKITIGQALTICIRDMSMILVTFLFHIKGKVTLSANVWGKLTTVLFYMALLFLLFEASFAREFLWFVIIFSYIASAVYTFLMGEANQIQKNREWGSW